MPLETGNTINALNANNPVATDGLGQSDDHIRLLKAVLLNTFANFTGALSATHTQIDAAATAVAGMPWGTSDLDDDAVTYAKMQNVSATDKLLGRSSSGAGNVEEIACTAAGRALLDDADAAAQRTTLGLATVANTGAYADLSGKPTLGTAAALDTGTTADKVVKLDGSAKLPAVDGSALTNLTYANIAGRDLVRLAAVTLGSAAASIEFGGTSGNGTIDGTYREYLFVVENAAPETNDVDFHVTVSDDNGSTYKATNYIGAFYVGNNSSSSAAVAISNNFIPMTGTGMANSANYGWCGDVRLVNPASTTKRKRVRFEGDYRSSTGGGAGDETIKGSAYWDGGNGAINGIKFAAASGNLRADTRIAMFGIR